MTPTAPLRLPEPRPTDRASECRVYDGAGRLIALIDPVTRTRRPVGAAERWARLYADLSACRPTPRVRAYRASVERELERLETGGN
jgi:hypothetical protein